MGQVLNQAITCIENNKAVSISVVTSYLQQLITVYSANPTMIVPTTPPWPQKLIAIYPTKFLVTQKHENLTHEI